MGAFALPIAVASTVLSAVGQQQAGVAARRAANFQAAQLEQNAGQARAAAQREAENERRRAALVGSHLQSLAGGGGLDPTAAKLAADITGEGEYRALNALYGGEEAARTGEMGAAAKRYEGQMAQRAGNLRAIGTILSQGTSLYQKYGSVR